MMKKLVIGALLFSMVITFGNPSLSHVDAAPISYLLEHGSITDLGGNQYRYVTHIGEKNTWHNGEWHRYVYFPDQKAVKIGHIYIQHLQGGALRIAGEQGTRVNDLKWYTQAYYGGQWNNISMPQYQFVGVEKEEFSITAYQMYWGIEGKMDIALRYDYTQNLKILVNVTSWSGASVPVRAIWHASGIRGIQDNYEWILDENDKRIGVNIEDTNFMWNDFTESSDIYTNVVVDQVENWVAVVFGNQTNIMNENDVWTIDPSVNPVIDADTNDDWWNYDSNGPVFWTHNTGSGYVPQLYAAPNFIYYGQFRFVLDIAADSTILSANFSAYESMDGGPSTSTGWRLNETNIGPLEDDTLPPARSNTTTASYSFDGVVDEWGSSNITDLVQDMINVDGWTSGNYFGIRWGFTSSNSQCRWQDYQAAGTNHAYLNITYEEAVTTTPTTTPTITIPQPPEEGINLFYELFYSLEPWGYLGVMALVLIGYFVSKKERNLGILWFVLECLFMANYLSFVNAEPNYWWHFLLLFLGGLATCVFPLWDRK